MISSRLKVGLRFRGLGWCTDFLQIDGMLLPPLCTQQGYLDLAEGAGLKMFGGPKDISKEVSKTW